MGDEAENARALEGVIGAAMPLYAGAMRPEVRAGVQTGPLIETVMVDVSSGDVQVLDWVGYAIRFPFEMQSGESAAERFGGWYVDLAFSGQNIAAAGAKYVNYVRLRPGETVRVPRGFDKVWLRPGTDPGPAGVGGGQVGPIALQVFKDPLVSIEAQRIIAPPAVGVLVVGTTGAAPVASTTIVTTDKLPPGQYEVRAGATSGDTANSNSLFVVRDSPDAADAMGPVRITNNTRDFWLPSIYLAVGAGIPGQRLRLRVNTTNASAGSSYNGWIWYRRIG